MRMQMGWTIKRWPFVSRNRCIAGELIAFKKGMLTGALLALSVIALILAYLLFEAK